MTTVEQYADSWRAADTRAKRAWLVAEAAKRGETNLCDAGLIRSTYLDGEDASERGESLLPEDQVDL